MLIFATLERVKKVFFVLFFFSASFLCAAQERLSVIKNLNEDWQVYKNRKFQQFNFKQTTRTVYFKVNPTEDAKYLIVNSKMPFSLFLNGQLVNNYDKQNAKLNIDSLSKRYNELFFSIHSSQPITEGAISTFILTSKKAEGKIDLEPRPNSTSDFFAIAALLLLMGVSFLVGTRPILVMDYLNPIRTFSMKEREGVLTSNRITSSSNILFYIFTCFLLSFLGLSWQIGSSSNSFLDVSNNTFGEAFVKWNLIALVIFGIFVLKFVWLAFFSFSFALKSGLHFHFYNFIRILILISILLAIISLMLYVVHEPRSFYSKFTYYLIGVTVASWLIVTYLKLLANSSFTFSHLFFYLCATEIVPLIFFVELIS